MSRIPLLALLLAGVSLGLAAEARAENTEHRAETLTADAAVRAALASNADLQAALERIAIARGRWRQAGRLQNPELEASYADDRAFQSEGERVASVGFAQRFPITARLTREKAVAREEVAIAEAEVRDFVRELIAEVERAFYAVRALEERIEVQRQLIESVRHVEAISARRLEAAEVSPAELSLVRIERLRLEQEAKRLERDREVAALELSRLLGRSPGASLRLAGDLDPGPVPAISDSSSKATIDGAWLRPDLEALRRQVERAEAERALARAEVWEDWTVRLGYDRDRQVFEAPIGVKADSFLSLGITVPLPLWNRQQGRIAAVEAEVRRARRELEGRLLRIQQEVRAADAHVRMLRSSADSYAQEILPEAARTQALVERGYRDGLVDIAQLLQTQRQYNETRGFYLELLGELRRAAIDLEAATGSSPHLRGFETNGGRP